MNEPGEIRFLKAKAALLETDKKHLTRKLACPEKEKIDRRPSKIIISLVLSEESHYDFPLESFNKSPGFDPERSRRVEQIIQLLKNTFRPREDVSAGRFEIIRISHWTWKECRGCFNWPLDKFLYFGGYPGDASLIGDEDRRAQYYQRFPDRDGDRSEELKEEALLIRAGEIY